MFVSVLFCVQRSAQKVKDETRHSKNKGLGVKAILQLTTIHNVQSTKDL